jgi:hypothetical protein
MAIPATNGARRTLIQSSSVKSLLAVTMRPSLAGSTPPIYPRMHEGVAATGDKAARSNVVRSMAQPLGADIGEV